MKNRITELLKVTYPILQGGMLWLATAELAAAVSNAGGLGIISPYAGMPKTGDPLDNLKKQIARARELTSQPFGVNIPLDLRQAEEFIRLVLEESVGIIVTAAGNPAQYTGWLKDGGLKVLHVISSVQQACKAEASGVDAIVAEGVEAGAHNGRDEIPLFSLLPQVADRVSIPVIAAGGIADARGWVAAAALGAEGIQMGTRFIAVTENIAHSNYKQAILNAGDTDTVITTRQLVPARSLKTAFTRALLELEQTGASRQELAAFLGYRRSWDSQIAGKLDEGEAFCGASAGLIREIVPVARVFQELVDGYERLSDELGKTRRPVQERLP